MKNNQENVQNQVKNVEQNVNSTNGNANKPQKSGKGKTIALIIIVLILVFALGVYGGLLISGKGDIVRNNIKDNNEKSTNKETIKESEDKEEKSTDKETSKESEEKEEKLNDSKEYSQQELEKMALDYYEAKTGYRPGHVASMVNSDGTISIQLYDDMGDHNSTSDWYTVDPKTAIGTDILKNKIDLKVKPVKEISGSGNNSNNVTNNSTKEEKNNKQNITLENTEKEVRRLNVGVANFVCREQEPTISGVDSSIARKIENKLKENYAEVWKEINEQSQDSEINEILTGYNENGNAEEIGFEQEYKIEYYNDKIITFKYIFSGGLGGVSWGSTSGISFYLNNGEEVNIEDIVTNKAKFKEACSKSVYRQLQNDDRYNQLEEDYKDVIDETIEKMSGYVVKNGIMCVEIPKYSIASGAAGQFDYVVSFDEISDYIDISKIK